MPTYEFKCDTCGNEREKYFSFTDAHYLECERCKVPMFKLIRATPAIFNGDGWAGKS